MTEQSEDLTTVTSRATARERDLVAKILTNERDN